MKTYVVKIDPEKPDKDLIESAANLIKEGKFVAFPTETVYGIAANFLDEKAIENLYRIKNRPRAKPFTIHIADIKTMESMGCFVTKEALCLIGKFWPGPLTIILKSGQAGTLGFRIPANKIALDLIKSAAVPIAAPSANISGEKSAASAEEVLEALDGRIEMLLDGGHTALGVESTVVDLSTDPPKILRAGAIKNEEIDKALASRKT